MKIKDAKRIIIKVGSALITDTKAGKVNQKWLDTLVEDIARLRKQNQEVLIVSSGAVALGKKRLAIADRPLRLEEKQAAAACGQLALTHAYQRSLSRFGYYCAQVLLTIEDSENRRRYLNAKETLDTLLSRNIIPVINENDTVATEELRVGDNDRLAARVAQMVGADLLILLSDVDGLYTANPRKSNEATHVEKVVVIDETIEMMADGHGSSGGSGGMITKISAAKIASASGCHTIIGKGDVRYPIRRLSKGARHTLFLSNQSPHKAKKRWLEHGLSTSGEIIVDNGAAAALKKGKSLLPAGVVKVKGKFERGDAVLISTVEGKEIGRGLVAYSAADARRIKGRKSSEIASILGFSGRGELVHRDDLVLT